MGTIIDHLDRRRVHHREVEGDTAVEDDIDVVIVVDIHHHQVPVRLIQVPRLIARVRHQVVHIEDVDADDLILHVHLHVHHRVQVIAVEVRRVRIRDVDHRHLVRLVRRHRHVVHTVVRDLEVEIEKLRVVRITINNKQTKTTRAIEVIINRVEAEAVEIINVVADKPTIYHDVRHRIKME